MGENYELVKYLWQNLFVQNLQDNPPVFDGASNKAVLLPKLVEIPDLPTSFLEIGPMYNPWIRSLVGKKEICRVHLSDPIYKTRGKPRAEVIGISSNVMTIDEYGLPELLNFIPKLQLGETTLILANVLNYVYREDVICLLDEIKGSYSPQVVVIGNNFNATLGHKHINAIESSEILEELLKSKRFQPAFDESHDGIFIGIYKYSF